MVARDKAHEVLIVGAGLCGLAIAYRLVGAGVDVAVLEQGGRVGEPWRGRHPQLRLNTHRWLSRLPGLALPRRAGAFPSRDAVIDYLERYAGMAAAPIAYGVKVERLDRLGSFWELRTSAGRYRAAHVVIATGRERVPVTPAWPGQTGYAGTIVHAADFGALDIYRDKRVLVVGAGNSGIDVLNHLARIPTRALWLSVRRGITIVPNRLGGIPVQRSAILVGRLPLPAADRLLALTQWLAFGNLRKHGLPSPGIGAATRLAREGVATAVDDGFVAALEAGRVSVVPAVERFERSSVVMADGRRLDPDVVICATGYRPGLETLLGHLNVLGPNGVPRRPATRRISCFPASGASACGRGSRAISTPRRSTAVVSPK